MSDESKLGLPFLAASLITVSFFIAWYRGRDPLVSPQLSISLQIRTDRLGLGVKLNLIPAVGFSDPILSYLSAYYFNFLDRTPVFKECYEKVMQD